MRLGVPSAFSLLINEVYSGSSSRTAGRRFAACTAGGLAGAAFSPGRIILRSWDPPRSAGSSRLLLRTVMAILGLARVPEKLCTDTIDEERGRGGGAMPGRKAEPRSVPRSS